MNNLNKKLTHEDKFLRDYGCKKNARNYSKFIKQANNQKFRKLIKDNLRGISDDKDNLCR